MSPVIAQLRDWWSARPERERRVLAAGTGALLLVIGYFVVWEPLHGLQQDRRVALAQARELATQLETLASRAGAGTEAAPGSRQQSLLSVVDQSVKTSAIGKAPSRIQPEGDSTVRVWFEDVPFDAVIRWLGELHRRHGIAVADAEVERESASGLVNARLTLVRKE